MTFENDAPVNVFVLGADEQNLADLEALPEADGVRFHPLLQADDLLELEDLDLEARLTEAEATLRDFDGSVDAIIGYWDFPVSTLVPVLCDRFGLPSARLEGILRCEHKYWSRREQAAAIEEAVPAFDLVRLDPDEPPPLPDVDFPFWLKPVKSASSQLAFHVEDEAGFREAIEEIQAGIDAFSEPFDHFLDAVDLPPEIAAVGSRACIAEEVAHGRQFTVEGYCVDDEPHVYGTVETVLYEDQPSFQRYQYPASVPDRLVTRFADLSERVMRRMGLGTGLFNVEYFWDPDTDRVRLLEVNPRGSQAHAGLFRRVDGVAHHQLLVQVGLGRPLTMPRGEGEHRVAATFFLRAFHDDAVVTRAPSPERVARIERGLPDVVVEDVVEQGIRLSDLHHQEPYSYVLASITVGASDQDELVTRYARCVEALDIELEVEDGDEKRKEVARA